MTNIISLLLEAVGSTIVLSFGRMNPITSGHELLINKVVSESKKRKADHLIVLSKSQDKKKNPLNVADKVKFAKAAFPGINIKGSDNTTRTLIEVIKSVDGKYKNVVLIAGSDRVPEFKTLLDKYNGKEYSFDSIEVVSSGERDPDADGVTGMSATKMRELAKAGDFDGFKKGVPSKMSDVIAKKMYDAIRTAMESTDIGPWDVVTHEAHGNMLVLGDKGTYLQCVSESGEFKRVFRHQVTLSESNFEYDFGLDKFVFEHLSEHTDPMTLFTISTFVKEGNETEIKTRLSGIPESAILEGCLVNNERKLVVEAYNKLLKLGDYQSINENATAINEALESRWDSLSEAQKGVFKELSTIAEAAGMSFHPLEQVLPFADTSVSLSRQWERIIEDEFGDIPIEDDLRSQINTIDFGALDSYSDEDFERDIEGMDLEDLLDLYDIDDLVLVDEDTGEVIELSDLDDELNEELINEVLSRAERIRSAIRMKRTKAQRTRKLKLALKRRANASTINRRSRRLAVKAVKARFLRGRTKISTSEKERIERIVKQRSALVKRLAMRGVSKVRKIENQRLAGK